MTYGGMDKKRVAGCCENDETHGYLITMGSSWIPVPLALDVLVAPIIAYITAIGSEAAVQSHSATASCRVVSCPLQHLQITDHRLRSVQASLSCFETLAVHNCSVQHELETATASF